MGTVFLAEQLALGSRPVALKVLRRKLLDDPEFLQRFEDEASSTGRIRHQNVVTVHECGQADDGSPYIAMEHLEGESLRDALKRRGSLPIDATAEILTQAARGLNAAHKLGIIHRDLKPDNIFLTHDDEGRPLVKILDFGIAKMRESTTRTLTGLAIGTPSYMSVEQAGGMRSSEMDGRSDIYSLGIVVYEMVAGCLPFQADTPMGYVGKHLVEPPKPLRLARPELAISPQTEDAVMKALRKNREERYSTAPEFAAAFARAIAPATVAEGIAAQPREPVPITKPAVRQPRKRWLVSPLAIVVAVVLILAVVVAAWYTVGAKTKTSTAVATPPVSVTKSKLALSPKGPSPGTVRVNPKDGQRYVWIPPGNFMMGCSQGDNECRDDERPLHQVTITKGFWMGQTAVTVGAWKRYRIATGTKALPTEVFGVKNLNEAGEDNMPASGMTWDEAKSYCEWASMRLPTEAEWEYAARAGTTAVRYGDLDSIAWYSGNSGSALHGVGLKQPNAWNLYDMLGNVWQWTADWYDAGYYAKSETENPRGATGGQFRVLRGGSWYLNPQIVRLSIRDRYGPGGRNGLGCRCVGELP